ncbi:MAG TPA: type II toxin-antitoxin system CcdA family antitoxin [Acidimicrobiales bacterium]|nr:type II toxin-antitoxin system CcdA family antitoxin [Acidimicrobiales bacterium]
MARVNVYLRDDLAEALRAAGLNVSSIAQEALRNRLRAQSTSAWLEGLPSLRATGVTHEQVIATLDEVRAEQGDEWPDAPPAGDR